MNRRDAYGLGAALILALAASAAPAQTVRTQPGFGGFDQGDVCYQWSGGHGSAGAFSRCNPSVQIAILTPTPAPLAAPPVAAPVMVPMQSCPPLTPKKPLIKPKRKPPVKC